jgi:hypothetical protein
MFGFVRLQAEAFALEEGRRSLRDPSRGFPQGESIPAGKKSRAFSIAHHAPDRQLTDADVKKAREKNVARSFAGDGVDRSKDAPGRVLLP